MQKILYLLLLISVASFGQSDKEKLNSNINNTKTDKHVNIPGTRIYIIPPPNYKLSPNTMNSSQDSVYFFIQDLKEVSFSSQYSLLKSKENKKNGSGILDSNSTRVNNYDAFFYKVKLDKTVVVYQLVFGANDFCESVYIKVSNINRQKEVETEIMQTLNSIYFDTYKKDRPFEATSFTLNDSVSIFQLKNYKDSIDKRELLFTLGGGDYYDYLKYPEVIVTEHRNVLDDSNDLKNSIDKKLELVLLNNTGYKVDKSIVTLANNYQAILVEIINSMKEEKIVLYKYYLKLKNKIVTLELSIKNEFNTNEYLQEFNKLVNTIKFK